MYMRGFAPDYPFDYRKLTSNFQAAHRPCRWLAGSCSWKETAMDARTLCTLIALALTLYITGCNTVKGVGKDIHDSAQNVQAWMEGSNENHETLSSAR
jgi:predicted small secreted protein